MEFSCFTLAFVALNQSPSLSRGVRLARNYEQGVNFRFQILDRKTASQQSLPNRSPIQNPKPKI
jgi:hypothetical protein